MEPQLQLFRGRGPNGMRQLFNVTERFSKSLDEIRGPNRKNNFLRQAQSWIKPSPARRAAAKTLGYGGIGLLISAIGITLFRRRREPININLKIKSKTQKKAKHQVQKAS